MTQIICGVDVGSESLDARIGQDGAWQQFARDADGIAELAVFCKTHAVDIVVMEATGGYERLPFAQLWGAGQPCAVVNPRAVRQFAEAMRYFEKTDCIDCGMIAWFAEIRRIKPMRPAAAGQQRLTALVVRLRQLTDCKVAQANQCRLVTEPDVLSTFDAVLAVIKTQTRSLEVKIAEAIDDDPLWAELDRVFRSIKGVADRTVAQLMACMPEIGLLSGKAISKLAGPRRLRDRVDPAGEGEDDVARRPGDRQPPHDPSDDPSGRVPHLPARDGHDAARGRQRVEHDADAHP